MRDTEPGASSARAAVLEALSPRAWLVSLGAWALVSVLVAATVVHTDARNSEFVSLLGNAAPAIAVYVLLTQPVFALDAWLTSRRRSRLVHVAALAIGGAAFISIIHVVSMTFGSGRALPWSWVVYALLITVSRARHRRRALRDRELQAESLRRQLAEARVVALQSRLQPHFLFNTLHAVASAVEDEPQTARRMLVRLSDLLRSVLDLQTPEIPLSRDLELLRPYVELQEIRFGDRLSVRLDIPVELGAHDVPALLLQPLVENAIQHGVGGRAEGGEIVVSARTDEGDLVVTVEDDGVGVGVGAPTDGIGLGGLRERVTALYGPGACVSLSPRDPRGATALVRIPRRTS